LIYTFICVAKLFLFRIVIKQMLFIYIKLKLLVDIIIKFKRILLIYFSSFNSFNNLILIVIYTPPTLLLLFFYRGGLNSLPYYLSNKIIYICIFVIRKSSIPLVEICITLIILLAFGLRMFFSE